jgi:hypothetical protein
MKKFFVAFVFIIALLVVVPLTLRSEAPATSAETSLALTNLAVPEEVGKVQERFTSTPSNQAENASRTIIQIQDVHAHVTAQQNIAAILERLRTVFGIERVALEGAWSSTSLPRSHAIPTSREKQLLAETLLDDDRISGPLYAAIMSPEPIMLIGIEEEASYEKNRSLFLTHLAKAKEIDEKLQAYGASLQALQKATWGPELLTFATAFGNFRETPDLGKFFPVLLDAAEAQHVDISDLSQIGLVRDSMAMEKLFQKEQLEQEVKHLMREYKNTPWTLEELIRGGKIPAERLGFYPEIKKMTRLFRMRDQISLRDLTAQIETLTSRILGKLVRTPEENALWEKTERFYLAKRILLLQASPADMKAYDDEKLPLEGELDAAGLTEALVLSLDFYELVKKRDEIFFNKIMNDPSLTGNVAIVTGGFHTDGLSQRFRDAGVSYVTITPALGSALMNENLYRERMTEPGRKKVDNSKASAASAATKPLAENPAEITSLAKDVPTAPPQTLSELRNALVWVDETFPESYEALLQTRDVREAKKFFEDGSAAASKPAKVSHWARRGKIVAEPRSGTSVSASDLRVAELMAKPRAEQLQLVQSWLTQVAERREKAMLVSSIGILSKMLLEEKSVSLLKKAVGEGDIVALAQDVPAIKTPEILSSIRGVERFEAIDIATLIEKTPRFQRLAKKRPFAIMENNRASGPYVVLPEKPVSLVLFRIITLNPSLYQAAKDPAFLALLEDLVAEIISKELSGKSA